MNHEIEKAIIAQLSTLKECTLSLLGKRCDVPAQFNYIVKAIREIEILRATAVIDLDDVKNGVYDIESIWGDASSESVKGAYTGGYNRLSTCVLCGATVPEGRQVCWMCEDRTTAKGGNHETG